MPLCLHTSRSTTGPTAAVSQTVARSSARRHLTCPVNAFSGLSGGPSSAICPSSSSPRSSRCRRIVRVQHRADRHVIVALALACDVTAWKFCPRRQASAGTTAVKRLLHAGKQVHPTRMHAYRPLLGTS
jgi:hypothetical protein